MLKRSPSTNGDPDVIIDVIFEDGLLFLSLENIGLASAYNVRASFKQKLWGIRRDKKIPVTGLPLFRKTTFMPPGKSIRTFLDSSKSFFGDDESTSLNATVRFQDSNGKKFVNHITHNLEIYRDIGFIQRSH